MLTWTVFIVITCLSLLICYTDVEIRQNCYPLSVKLIASLMMGAIAGLIMAIFECIYYYC